MNGQGRMAGILYRAFLVSFEIDRREASVPFGIRTSTRNLLGPLAGIIGQKYGIQKTILFGGITSAFGTALCFLLPDIASITVFWGIIGSIGAALCMVQIQVVVGQYFKKYKTTAQGIAFSGACVGSFLFPVAVQWILKTYGIPGVFLIIAGMVLHTLPAAMVCKKPDWLNINPVLTVPPEPDVQFLRNNENPILKLLTLKEAVDESLNIVYEESQILEEIKSMYTTPCYSHCTLEKKDNVSIFSKNSAKTMFSKKTCFHDFCRSTRLPSCNNFIKREFDSRNESAVSLRCYTLSRIKHLLGVEQDKMAAICPDVDIAKMQLELEKLYNRYSNCNPVDKSKEKNTFWHHIQTSKGLLRNPSFLLICLCRIAHFLTFMPMMTTIVDFTVDRGFHEDEGSAVIAVLSVGDLVGRLFFGWVTDKGILGLQRYMLVTMVAQGINVATFPFMPNKASIYVFLCLFGILQGTIFVHHPTLVQKYVKSESHSIAMGCMDFFPGLVGLAMPFYIGFFRDRMGSYDFLFQINGLFTALVGLVWALEPRFHRRSATDASD